ncbi:hypothetical protein SMI01S_11780 [Sphingobacterium mizutaii NBRC 14946 = DSM 11724]|uniref:Uncharacterized protein n=2 Tax=Sphingobacterium mizutaii TaxID=1010 RepID=A0AAJ4XCU6_9SPHI|nr:hypothetical protein [Sphingobacterium mizutaii]GEM67572.1 hypothetical protein SMI01S_11780 [Sphingobacterium mizutaii NBRC 14946 = DSM 11724]SDL14469.1 hypothetical protein SAMN05192578_1011512 [Sphingobacterium mizutaii]SNV52147.1 Uncharacterised protein [Sphingobacterium mizutaii]
MNEHLSLADLTMKEKVLDYLNGQLDIKLEAIKYHESADLMSPEDSSQGSVSVRQFTRLQLENEITELRRHIAIIKLL